MIGLFDKAYQLVEQLIDRLDRLIELLEEHDRVR